MWRVLDDEFVEGVVEVETRLRPGREARLLDVTNYGAAAEQVRWACQVWGGAADLMVPVEGGKIPEVYSRLLRASEIDALHVDPPGTPASQQIAPFLPQQRLRRLPALVAVSASERAKLRTLEVCEVPVDDPWGLAYLTVLGYLPEKPDPVTLSDLLLSDELTFEQFVSTRRVPVTDPGSADLLARLHASDSFSPVTFTRHKLRSKPHRGTQSALDGWLDDPWVWARRENDTPIVVYTPSNVPDLCLLWNLRALYGWSSNTALGVPWLGDAQSTVDAIKTLLTNAPHPISGWPVNLTSASLDADTMEALVGTLKGTGQSTTGSTPDELLLPAVTPARVVETTLTFSRGSAVVSTRSDRDRQELQLLGPGSLRPDLFLGVRLQDQPLPPTHSLTARPGIGPPDRFTGGAYALDASQDQIGRIRWPTGFTVLRSLAHDRGVEAAPSASGKTAMALLNSLGSIQDITWLAHRPLLQLLYKKAASSGMSWWKQRATELAKKAAKSADDPEKATEELLAAIHDVSVSHGGESADTLTFGELCGVLGGRQPAARWLEWAEQRSLLIRGTKVQCPRCQHENWRLLADISPPLLCPGCGQINERPFGESSLQFSFRLGEALRRTLEHDSIYHLLAMRTLTFILESGPDPLVGVHPGVDFTKGDEQSEADVVAVLASGAVLPVEVKKTSTGLKPHDLSQMDLLAGWLESPTVVFATADTDDQLAQDFLDAARDDARPWRRLLSGDDLFVRYPSTTFGSRLPGPDDCQSSPLIARESTAKAHDERFASYLTSAPSLDAPADPTASALDKT